MKNNRILPVGLKGNQINERMLELMGVNQINENKSAIAVELTKMGPDGKAYAIIRENHEYYIKSTNKTSGLIAEDFKYIGGLQNKKQEAYPTYAKAIKHLNLKFNSIQEALDTRIDINVFEDDNLLKEDIAGFSNAYGGGFSGAGNLEGNSSLFEEEDCETEEIPENPEDYTKQSGYIHEEDEEMSDEEKAIDEMLDESWMEEELTGNQGRIDMNHNDAIDGQDFAIMRGMKDDTEETNEPWMEEDIEPRQMQKDALRNAKTPEDYFDAAGGEDLDVWDVAADMARRVGRGGEEILSYLAGVIGGPEVKQHLQNRKMNNGGDMNNGINEGKLSIEKAINEMDDLIDSLGQGGLKKKD